MKRIISFLSLLTAIVMILPAAPGAEKVAELPELMRPAQFNIGLDRIFVTEGATVYVYSLKDFKLIKKFGKSGEGPQEFKITPFGPPMLVFPYQDKLYVSSDAKISQFTLEGKFLSEAKVPAFQVYRPFTGNSYIFSGMTVVGKDPHLSISLANQKFEKMKTVYVSDMTVGPNVQFKFPLNPIEFEIHNDTFFVPTGNDKFVIDVFDKKGNKLYSIEKKFPAIKVPEAYKKATLDWFQTSPNYKNVWEFFKTRVSFRDDYPAIRTIVIDDGKLFVLTYKTKGENSQCLILDLKGKKLKEEYVYVPPMIGMDFHPKYSFYKGAYYLIKENEDEVWELFKTQLIK